MTNPWCEQITYDSVIIMGVLQDTMSAHEISILVILAV